MRVQIIVSLQQLEAADLEKLKNVHRSGIIKYVGQVFLVHIKKIKKSDSRAPSKKTAIFTMYSLLMNQHEVVEKSLTSREEK